MLVRTEKKTGNKVIAHWLHSDCTLVAASLHTGCRTTARRLQSHCKRLCSNTAHRLAVTLQTALQSDCNQCAAAYSPAGQDTTICMMKENYQTKACS